MSCFFVIFHRNLEVMLFPRKMKIYIVFTLILRSLNVTISLVLEGVWQRSYIGTLKLWMLLLMLFALRFWKHAVLHWFEYLV